MFFNCVYVCHESPYHEKSLQQITWLPFHPALPTLTGLGLSPVPLTPHPIIPHSRPQGHRKDEGMD